MARKPTIPRIEEVAEEPVATAEAAATVLGRGEGIQVDDSNTGDDRDIGDPEPIPEGFDAGFEATPGTIPDKSTDLLGRLTEALESLAHKQAPTGDPQQAEMMQGFTAAMTVLAGAIERMTEGQLQGAQIVADATKKAQRPSNDFYPAISVFNLRGDKDFPKPPLKCEMFIPWPAEHESLTREEVELLNLLIPGEYRIKRNDNTVVKVTCRVITKLDSDEPNRLMINHDTAFNNDYHRMMPPLENYLRQMLKQNPRTRALADSVLTMEEEQALIAARKFNDGREAKKGEPVISIGQ